ncbi:MAG: methionyl-tRNA formyltransferase [Rhizobiales bacterium]|nr:methionyl-tRNA formyltransferase [Hyphomicrobiales bacterium]
MSLRIVFMGTPEFSVPTLTAIIGQGHEVVACYSQPPRPAGRGMEEKKSPVHEAATKFGIPVFTPTSLKGKAEQQVFASLKADVAIVVAYGLLLPQAILDAPTHGCFNGHASALPRWRGAAPIQRAIMAGDTSTAAMVMKMDIGLDTGPIAMAEKIVISENMTAGELHDELSMTGADLMTRALGAIERDLLNLTDQSEDGVTYAKKIEKAEAHIDFSKPAEEVHNHIRGLSPFPGAWCELEITQNEKPKMVRVKIIASQLVEGSGEHGTTLDDGLTIACGSGVSGVGAIRPIRLQRAGKGKQNLEEFLRGSKVDKGAKLA